MRVLDASVVVEVLLGGLPALALDEATLRESWAPHHLDAEVGQALRRLERTGLLDPVTAAAALRDLVRFPLRRVPLSGLILRAWELRANVSFYDALYVALAEQLDVPLLTLDERLAAAPGPGCVIEVP